MENHLRRFFIREGKLHPGWRVTLYFIATMVGMLLIQAPIAVVYIVYLSLSGLPLDTMLLEIERLPLALTLPLTIVELGVILLLTYLLRL